MEKHGEEKPDTHLPLDTDNYARIPEKGKLETKPTPKGKNKEEDKEHNDEELLDDESDDELLVFEFSSCTGKDILFI